MAGRGGFRPGAGRPRKHGGFRPPPERSFKQVFAETPVRAAERKIADRLPWLIDQLFALAEGVHAERVTKSGTVVVYQCCPDRQSIEYLIDRVMGKPMQPVEVDVYDTARQLAEERGLDPARVISILDDLKQRRAG